MAKSPNLSASTMKRLAPAGETVKSVKVTTVAKPSGSSKVQPSKQTTSRK